MSLGEVLSGFTFEGNGDNIMIAYGEKRRSGLMNCIGITRLRKGVAKKVVGFAFVKCQLDDTSNVIKDVDVEILESKMKHYCIMLPLLDDGDFFSEFAIIYDDWDVGDDNFVKALPNICPFLFLY